MGKHCAVLALVCVSCAAAELPGGPPAGHQEQPERWNIADRPELLDERLELNLAVLPIAGAVRMLPWVGSYWPTYLDNINYRWDGPQSMSAAAKYQKAFGGNHVEDSVSRFHGLDSASLRPACTHQSHCAYGDVCGIRAGRQVGTCVPFWWGICQAWAAAAILHREPVHPVIHNGVLFKVMDIKALLSLAYHTPATKQISLRCEIPPENIPYDAVGRPTDPTCRDSNPGTYHLLLANRIGLRGESFIEDRTLGQDVWNQPIRSYRIQRMQEVSVAQANGLLGIGNYDYPYNPVAERLVYVVNDISFIRESPAEQDGNLSQDLDKYTWVDRYEYILELSDAGDIVGGEWVGRSKGNHPDFLWLPTGTNATAAAGGAIAFDKVMQLLELSYAPEPEAEPEAEPEPAPLL